MPDFTLFKCDPAALIPTLSVRLRFATDRFNAKQSWTQAEYDAAKRELDAIHADAEKIAAGKNILATGREMLMGYHSDLDDSNQPYSLWIPDSYDGTRALPLVVLLHGQGMFNPLQCRAQPIGNRIVVAPQGRGGMDYMYVGEEDVLTVLDQVQSLLNVDATRVYAAGISMGGTGAWHLASRFPDRFAAIMPLCGNTDINVWADLWHWRTPEQSPIAGVRQFLREDTSSVTYAKNLQHVRVIALQGEADTIVNQRHAKNMLTALKASGHAQHEVHILPYMTHGISANFDLGLREIQGESKPTRVQYKTAWLRYSGAYWIHITAFEQRLRHASVDAKAAPALRTISISTENATELRIDPARLPIQGVPIQIEIDRQVLKPPFATDAAGAFAFGRDENGAWTSGTRAQETAYPPAKCTRVEGPIEHAFMTPFVVASGEVSKNSSALAVAANAAADQFVNHWRTRYAVPCRKKSIAELSYADNRDSNLILFGSPETHPYIANTIALIKRAASQSPFEFNGQSIRIGDENFTGPNLGAMLCYPNPLNPKRYIVLIPGTTPQSYTDINVRFGNWFDWVPFDFRKHFDFAVFDDLTSGRHPETFLTWGFFNEQWKLAPALTFSAVESFRRVLVPRVFPTVRLKELAQDNSRPETVYLDAAFTEQESMTKEYLERNRTLEGSALQLLGKNYERGLCCRFPCALTFSCTGYQRLKLTAGVSWDGVTEPCDDRKQFEKVYVSVVADGKPLFEAHHQMYNSAPLSIDVDLGGAKSVTLSANGGLPWLNGSFIFADARLEGVAKIQNSKVKIQKRTRKKTRK